MSYYVIDAAGNPYGPAELSLLQHWAQEGRVQPSTTIRDAATGRQMVASNVPGLFAPHGSPTYGSPGAATPYSSSPYQPSGAAPAYYPRPYAGDDGSRDAIAAWVLGILSIILVPVCCALVGLPLGIIGVFFARRAQSKGSNAQVPMILSYVGIGLRAVFSVIAILGLLAAGSSM